jgi:hypothetical protein
MAPFLGGLVCFALIVGVLVLTVKGIKARSKAAMEARVRDANQEQLDLQWLLECLHSGEEDFHQWWQSQYASTSENPRRQLLKEGYERSLKSIATIKDTWTKEREVRRLEEFYRAKNAQLDRMLKEHQKEEAAYQQRVAVAQRELDAQRRRFQKEDEDRQNRIKEIERQAHLKKVTEEERIARLAREKEEARRRDFEEKLKAIETGNYPPDIMAQRVEALKRAHRSHSETTPHLSPITGDDE